MVDDRYSHELRAYLSPAAAGKRTRFSWQTLGRFSKTLFAHKALIAGGIGAMIMCVMATLAGPWLLGRLVDGLVAKDPSVILVLAFVFAAAETVRISASVLQSYLIGSAGEKVMHDLRIAICGHVVSLPTSRLDTTSSGILLARATSDVVALSAMFSAGILNIVEKLVVVCSIVVTMFLLDPSMAAVALAPFVPVLIVAIAISIGLHRAYHFSRQIVSGVSSFLLEAISGLRIIRVFDAGEITRKRFEWLSRKLAYAQIRPAILSGMLHPTMTVVTAASMGLLATYGLSSARSGHLQVGLLVTFFSYVLWIFWPIMHAIAQWNVIIAGVAAAERIFELLDWEPERDVAGDAPLDLAAFRGEIEFENVWFSYRGDEQWILKNASFKVSAGTMTGIVGATGSGKSTIIALLLRLYEPQKGEIKIDGITLDRWPKRVLRELIGIVRQDIVVFDGTIAENITLFRDVSPHLPPEALAELEKRGMQLTTQVGSGDRELSVGERQLLSFCRVLARRPHIWILDEATAHLDPWLDRELEKLLTQHAPDRSVLCIAHRLSSVAAADQILVLSDGKVAEAGSHRELVARNGLYSRYFRVQSRLQQGSAVG